MADSGKNKNESPKSTAKKLAGGVNRLMLSIAIYAVIVFITFTLSIKVYDMTRNIYSDKPLTAGENAKSVVITVDKDDSYASVAKTLYEGGVIGDKTAFRLRERLEGVKFVPGTYVISSDMSFKEILDELSGNSKG
ncbi:MAG: endolytic transglycosylase MltG [Lachnospiraceae bacterium]|nr:endolytic transglycosylase MltG [Lachnospiraceae bacterium]